MDDPLIQDNIVAETGEIRLDNVSEESQSLKQDNIIAHSSDENSG